MQSGGVCGLDRVQMKGLAAVSRVVLQCKPHPVAQRSVLGGQRMRGWYEEGVDLLWEERSSEKSLSYSSNRNFCLLKSLIKTHE